MILAYWSDWGVGERVWEAVMFAVCLFMLFMWWVFVPSVWKEGRRLAPIVGTILVPVIMVFLIALPFRMEQTRRDTLAVHRELAKLDGGEITYMQVSNKDSRVQLDFNGCKVELGRRHLKSGPWVFALFTGKRYRPAGPGLQAQIDDYCRLISS